jgi:laccase
LHQGYRYPGFHHDSDPILVLLVGEWWQRDLMKVDKNFSTGGHFSDNPAGATINGKLGDLYNCSGKYFTQ